MGRRPTKRPAPQGLSAGDKKRLHPQDRHPALDAQANLDEMLQQLLHSLSATQLEGKDLVVATLNIAKQAQRPKAHDAYPVYGTLPHRRPLPSGRSPFRQ